MKKLVVFLSLFPLFASAHGTKIEMVDSATHTALQKFTAEEDKKIVDEFNAVKSWVSGSQIKVKVYYNANANSLEYVCEMMQHSEGQEEMMMCSK